MKQSGLGVIHSSRKVAPFDLIDQVRLSINLPL